MSVPKFARIPSGIWINLTLIRLVQVLPSSTPRIRVIWDKNTSDFLDNEQALAVIKALEETDFIDMQQFSTEEHE